MLAWIALVGTPILAVFLIVAWTDNWDWLDALKTTGTAVAAIGFIILVLTAMSWGFGYIASDHKTNTPTQAEKP
jgi:hypothetical protein